MSIVLAIANQKGGVGKTTTAVNVGAGMARKGHRVLLIDMDPQASLTHFLRLDGPGITQGTVGDWMMDRKQFDEVVCKTRFAGMEVVRSNAALTGDETFLLTNAQYLTESSGDGLRQFRILERAVDTIRERYDYILVDSPPTFSHLFTNAIFACDRFLIPTKMEFLSIRALGPLIRRLEEIKSYKPSVDILGVVGTLFRVNVNEQISCLDETRQKAPEAVMKTLIRQNVTLAQSASYGMPIQFFDSNSAGAKDYDQLTQEVMERCKQEMKLVAAH